MTSERQIQTNRQNAQYSTGPKTENGKAVVAKNALRHGVFSNELLLDEESKKDFEKLEFEFYEYFQPEGLLERLFWDRALAAAWRLSRVTKMETMLIEHAVSKSFDRRGIIQVLASCEGDELTLLSRYEISLEKVLFRSLAELRALQVLRKQSSQSPTGFVPQNLAKDISAEVL